MKRCRGLLIPKKKKHFPRKVVSCYQYPFLQLPMSFILWGKRAAQSIGVNVAVISLRFFRRGGWIIKRKGGA